MKTRKILIGIAIGLAVIGSGLIVLAADTPWHTDSRAYFAGLQEIRSRLYDDESGSATLNRFDEASMSFHALQDRYRTQKWLYADLGYAAVAWSLLLFVTAGVGLRPTRRFTVVLPAALAAVGLLVVGTIAAAFQAVGREQVPIWADSLAIPLMASITVGLLLLPLVVSLASAPLVFTRREPVALLSVVGRGWPTSVIVSLVYLCPAALAILAMAVAWETGGWAISTGGAILLWIMLNARAVWLGRAGPASV